MRTIIKSISKMLLIACCVVLLSPTARGNVHAANDKISERNYAVSGTIELWENYYLDIEETEIMDFIYPLMNSIANILFWIVKGIGYYTCKIFELAIDLDIAALFSEEINNIQSTLKEDVFNALLILALTGTSVSVLKRFAKRDLIGMVEQFGKSLLIIILAVLMATHSDKVLSVANTITKTVSIRLLAGMNGNSDSSTERFAADAVAVLWNNLVHEPWKALQFTVHEDSEIGEGTVNSFLKMKKNNPGRKDLVEDNKAYLPKESAVDRIGMLLVFLFPFIGKCVLFIAVAAIQVVFQALGIFFFLLGLIVLLLALLPGYEMDFFWVWLKKLMEMQLNILIVVMLMGFMIKIDSLLFAVAGGSTLGWIGITILQTAVLVGIYLGRNQIINAFSNMQKSIKNPGYTKRILENSGNIVESGKNIGKVMNDGMRKKVNSFNRVNSKLMDADKRRRDYKINQRETEEREVAKRSKREFKEKWEAGEVFGAMEAPKETHDTEKNKTKKGQKDLKPTQQSRNTANIPKTRVVGSQVVNQKEIKDRPRLLPKQTVVTVGVKQNNEMIEQRKVDQQVQRRLLEQQEEGQRIEKTKVPELQKSIENRQRSIGKNEKKVEVSKFNGTKNRNSSAAENRQDKVTAINVRSSNVITVPKSQEMKKEKPRLVRQTNDRRESARENVTNRTRKTAGR